MRKKAVIVGAGALGLGFLAERMAGEYDLVLVDLRANAETLDRIRERQSYTANIASLQGITPKTIGGSFETILSDGAEGSTRLNQALEEADLILTATGRKLLDGVVARLAPAMRARKRPGWLLFCENGLHIASSYAKDFPPPVRVADTVMSRMCRLARNVGSAGFSPSPNVGSAGFSPSPRNRIRPEGRTPNKERPEGHTPNKIRPEGRTPNKIRPEGRTPNASQEENRLEPLWPGAETALVAEDYSFLPLDAETCGSGPFRPAFTMVSHAEFICWEDVKLYLHNGMHAFVSYHAFLAGVRSFPETPPAIRERARRAMLEEVVPAIVRTHPVAKPGEIESYGLSLLERFFNPHFNDSIERGIRGIEEKLAPGERLLGACEFIRRAGIEPALYATAIQAAREILAGRPQAGGFSP